MPKKNCSQLEKEGLACVFGVKKFYNYLYGHKFDLVTDHKPLLRLLSEDKPTSPQASARVRRWSLYMSRFEYTIKFRGTKEHSNADPLSRLPLPVTPEKSTVPPELVLLTRHLDDLPVTATHIKAATNRDRELCQVVQFLQKGWPANCPNDEMKPYFTRRSELSLYDGCVLWGNSVVVPKVHQEAVLVQLHDGHPGIAKMKAMARMYVWWPGISSEIERVRQCHTCQLQQSVPAVAPLQTWSWPTRPWARLHIDYAGPVEGKMILVLIDAHSKWIEAFHTKTATSQAVIEELRTVFSRFGIPEVIVTDNGACFTSSDFESFLQYNGVKHLTSAPYHPSSNGLAERAIQIVKKGLKKVKSGSIGSRLAKILLHYRMQPQETTGLTPAELLLKKQPRTRLDLLKPNTAERIEQKQQKQKDRHDAKSKDRTFKSGDQVYVRNYLRGDKWLPGVIIETITSQMFKVKLSGGRVRRCHIEQIRRRDSDVPENSEIPIPRPPEASETPRNLPARDPPEPSPTETSETPNTSPSRPSSAGKVYPLRRNPKPIERYEPSWT